MAQRPRGERRVAELLEAAAAVIAEVGYEAATMKAICLRAGASVGAVYQYYPHKEALAQALHRQYGDEIEARFAPLIEQAAQLAADELARRLVETVAGFIDSRPAYVNLLGAPIKLARSQEARHRFRRRLREAFVAANPALDKDQAQQTANVAVQTLKGFGELYAAASGKAKAAIADEYKAVFSAYLGVRL